MAVNRTPPNFPNSPQIRVKSFQTYNQLLLDKFPATFSMVLNDGKRSGFYIRTSKNFYKVGSLQIQSNAVPLSSDGLSDEEAAQILVKWSDITDRPTVTPSEIDSAILNPNVMNTGYSKEIISIQPSGTLELKSKTWYIVNDGGTGDYSFKLPSMQPHLSAIKVSIISYRVAVIAPPVNGTINASTQSVSVTNNTVEFVFNANTNDWLMVN